MRVFSIMQTNDRNFSVVKQRILEYLDFQGVSKYECYQKTGIANGILSQKNGISEENLLKFFSQYSDISPEWLLTGRGEMLRSVPPAAQKPPQKLEKPYSESAIFAELVAQRKMFEGQISRLLELLENLSKKISGESTAL